MVSRETVGTFLDAVYAIAATILALEIPGELGGEFSSTQFFGLLLDYAMSFVILFALWMQHRQINGLMEHHSRLTLWLSAVVLLLVCLVPRATTLVFEYGGDVTLDEIEQSVMHGAGWTVAEFVDIFYVATVLAADLALLLLAILASRGRQGSEAAAVRQSKFVVSGLIFVVLLLSLLAPFENRYFLLVIPVALVFDQRISALIFRSRPTGTL